MITAQAVPMTELWRGHHLESCHRGHAVVVDRSGAVVAAWGDPARLVFPRSALKAIQALPFVESGAMDHYRLPESALALACGSHWGTPEQTALAESILAAANLDAAPLACGAHPPEDRETAAALIRAGLSPAPLHNNCSGKHAAMLATAQHCGESLLGYEQPGHPVQRRIRAALEDLAGESLAEDAVAVDGCNAPAFALSLAGLARAIVSFADPGRRSGKRGAALTRIAAAWGRHPLLIGHHDAFDSRVMALAPGLLVKSGAEGVGVAVAPQAGLACAVKIEDGTPRGKDVAMLALLRHLGVVETRSADLDALAFPAVTNWNGRVVGAIRPAPGWPAQAK